MRALLLSIPQEWVALGAVVALAMLALAIVAAVVGLVAAIVGYFGTRYYEDLNRYEATMGHYHRDGEPK